MNFGSLEREARAQYEAYLLEVGDGFTGYPVDITQPWYNIALPLAANAEE